MSLDGSCRQERKNVIVFPIKKRVFSEIKESEDEDKNEKKACTKRDSVITGQNELSPTLGLNTSGNVPVNEEDSDMILLHLQQNTSNENNQALSEKQTDENYYSDNEEIYQEDHLLKLQLAIQSSSRIIGCAQSNSNRIEVSCSHCNFITNTIDELSEHIQDAHATIKEDQVLQLANEPVVSTPNKTSNKEKIFPCKKCSFKTNIKYELWTHYREHHKTTQFFKCQECPFVTKNLYNLQYHMNIHTISEPIRCTICPYICANESILNSHMKTHKEFQYCCVSCPFGSNRRYLLMAHVKKYHRHSTDVYTDPHTKPYDNNIPSSQFPVQEPYPQVLPSSAAGTSVSMPETIVPYPNRDTAQSFPLISSLLSTNDPPESPPITNEYLVNQIIGQSILKLKEEYKKEYAIKVGKFFALQQIILARTHQKIEDITRSSIVRRESQSVIIKHSEQHIGDGISKQENISQILLSLQDALTLLRQTMPVISLCPEPCQKSEQISPTSNKFETIKMSPNINFHEAKNNEFKSIIANERKTRWMNIKEIYDCPFCDLLFGDFDMYNMHLNCHSYENPFTCSMCGIETADKLQFFSHFIQNHNS